MPKSNCMIYIVLYFVEIYKIDSRYSDCFFSICMSDMALCCMQLLTSRLNLCRSLALDFFIWLFSFAAYAMISFFTSLFVCSTASSLTWEETLSAICYRTPGSFFLSIAIAMSTHQEKASVQLHKINKLQGSVENQLSKALKSCSQFCVRCEIFMDHDQGEFQWITKQRLFAFEWT